MPFFCQNQFSASIFALSKLATCRIFLQLFVFHIASSQFLHWTMKFSCSADVPHVCIPFLVTRDLDQPTKGLSVNIFNEAWVSCLNPTTRDYKESHFRIDCVMPDSEPGMSPCLRKLSLTAMKFSISILGKTKVYITSSRQILQGTFDASLQPCRRELKRKTCVDTQKRNTQAGIYSTSHLHKRNSMEEVTVSISAQIFADVQWQR